MLRAGATPNAPVARRAAGASWRVVCAAALAACASTDPAVVEQRIATPDGAVFVRSGGVGPDVVLLHGLGDAGVGWRKVEEPLRAAGFRVHVWDALGAGSSDGPPDADYGLPAHVDRLVRVLDALGVARAHLVGNSLGGTVALLAALEHPGRVDRLVLVNPAASTEGGTTASWFWDTPLLAESALTRVPPAWIARVALGLNFGDPGRISDEDLRVYAELASRPGAIRALARQQRQLIPGDATLRRWTTGLATIDAPTLILWGTADRVLPASQGERLRSVLPRARLVPVDGVGHVLQLEDPARFLAEAVPFLR